MSLIARPVARRIDRLALHAHRFHRFAHHPLCIEYRGELVSLGRRTRVCRGCAFSLLGGSSGVGLGFVLPMPSLAVSLGLSALAIAGGAGLTLVRLKRQRPRWPKTLSRFLPIFMAAYAVVSASRQGPLGSVLGSAALGIAALAMLAYRRQGPDRSPCVSCPERHRAEPCRGVLPIVRRERAFRRLAGLWMAGSKS